MPPFALLLHTFLESRRSHGDWSRTLTVERYLGNHVKEKWCLIFANSPHIDQKSSTPGVIHSVSMHHGEVAVTSMRTLDIKSDTFPIQNTYKGEGEWEGVGGGGGKHSFFANVLNGRPPPPPP